MKRVFLTDDYCHQLVMRRLCALDYIADDAGTAAAFGDTTGQYAGGGYIADDAGTAAAFGDTSGQYADLPPGLPAGAPSPSSPGNSSWVSGLSGLFGAIGTTFTNVTRATSATGRTINPQTGLPYGYNPQTGRPYPTAQNQNTFLLIAFALIVGWVVFKR